MRALLSDAPSGFRLHIEGGSSSPDTANHYRTVDFGEVLIAEFRAWRPPTSANAGGDPEGSIPIIPESTTSSDTPPATETSSSTTRDAGTGGSAQVRANTDNWGGRHAQNTGGHAIADLELAGSRGPAPAGFLHSAPSRWIFSTLCNAILQECLDATFENAGRLVRLLCLVVTFQGLLSWCAASLASIVESFRHRRILWIVLWFYAFPHAAIGVQVHRTRIGSNCEDTRTGTIIPALARTIPRPLFAASAVIRPEPIPFGDLDRESKQDQSQDDTGTEVQHEALETLLEQALKRPETRAMMLAATLVETLVSHFAEDPTEHFASDNGKSEEGRVCIALSHHLSTARSFDLTHVQVNVGCTLDHIANLLGTSQ